MTERIVLLFFSSFLLSSFQVDTVNTNRLVTFLQVDLVCGAASDIGCGSRSKPILNDLEGKSEIAEGWLSRPGTNVAVVWEDDVIVNDELLIETLKTHKKSGRVLSGNESNDRREEFESEKWYRSNEVDELSIEEAGRIAEMVISAIKDQGSLSDSDAPIMQDEVEEFIKNELLTLEDVNLLNERSYYKGWESGIKNIASSYMDQSEVDKIHLFVVSSWIRYSIYGGALIVILLIAYLFRKWRVRTKDKENE